MNTLHSSPQTGIITLGKIGKSIDSTNLMLRSHKSIGKGLIISFSKDAAGLAIILSPTLTKAELWNLGFKSASVGHNVY